MEAPKIPNAYEDSEPSRKNPRSWSSKKPRKHRRAGILAVIGEAIGSSLSLQPFAEQLQPIIEKSLAEGEQSGSRKGTFFTPVRTIVHFGILHLLLSRTAIGIKTFKNESSSV